MYQWKWKLASQAPPPWEVPETTQSGDSRRKILEKIHLIYFAPSFLGDQDFAAIFKMQLGVVLPLRDQIKEHEVKWTYLI